MSTTRKPGWWWRVIGAAALFVAVLATLELALPSEQRADAADGSKADANCKSADRPVSEVGARKARKQIRCLVNEERDARGRHSLDRVKSLRVASQRHARAMVARDCLAHRCGDEDDLAARLKRAGYFRDAMSWRYAESTGCGPSAKAMVANWMATRYHRENILKGIYRDLGVGVVKEPVEARCDKGYATFAVVFARRKLARGGGHGH